ncbi:NUDIX domain-containing protein [Caulobacter mirabilis]|uniref:ADP-ribose pyrophosphatase n=1 Tax=Caulobacter mirabilis TaxID=69666 RepID=A0A2D2AXK4_9CAUL|nr:NUDIX domain-containing protein [Caulobacter mirabilis]ATQ42736.1 ADP-ribose pyrophosphatase [Caulobacter mirabilis]
MSDSESKRPGAACGAAILRDGRLLLVKRLRQPEADHWGLPGGKIDWGEGLRAAVAREIAEEVGLTITPDRLLCIAETIDKGDGMHWVAPTYLVEDAVGEAALLEPDKMGGVAWFPLDALPEPLTDATKAALAALKGLKS